MINVNHSQISTPLPFVSFFIFFTLVSFIHHLLLSRSYYTLNQNNNANLIIKRPKKHNHVLNYLEVSLVVTSTKDSSNKSIWSIIYISFHPQYGSNASRNQPKKATQKCSKLGSL